MMKKFVGSFWAKAAAFTVFCVSAVLSVCCVIILIASGEATELGISSVPFSESNLCRIFVEDRLNRTADYIYWNGANSLTKDKVFFTDESFSYKLKDENGRVLVDTTEKNSKSVISDYYTHAGKGEEYTLEGFIDLPVEKGSPAYYYYLLHTYSANALLVGLISVFAAIISFVFLMAAAGKNAEGETVLVGLNRLPWDIFAMAAALACTLPAAGFDDVFHSGLNLASIASFGLWSLLLAIIGITFCFGMASRFKVRGWWKNCIAYKVLAALWRFCKWFIAAIPQTWLLILVYCGFVLANFFLMLFAFSGGGLALVLLFMMDCAGLAGVIWFALQLKSLKKAGEAIAKGDFDYKVSIIELWPGLREHGKNLNSAAAGMSMALAEKMKSERFKTELITNVSHDLKTPLTSIVSYVDLLKKEEIENENAREYIEVIDRQSAKLKKLTEDLVEASKASSGAVAVNRERLDIGELINQSVGEFAERFEEAEITPVVNVPEEEIFVFTDGRLLWRVFDNLIQNILKYAQCGTRAYFDLAKNGDSVSVIIKNVSREPLNMTAEALMERFVRGDSSRGECEGNGLGLSIAKSLTELCGGRFELSLDGDLYKVLLTFPAVK